jgi:outer membrane protein OmpA-like peptidoglycan-associated protein
MKKICAMLAVLVLMAGMATAAPTIWGSSGMFRTISAQNAGPMNFGIGAYLYGWKWDNDSTATSQKSGAMDMAVRPSGYFSINDMFELSLGTNYLMPSSYVEYGGTKYTYNPSGLGNTRVGLKVSIPAGDKMWLAAYFGYDIATVADTFKNAPSGRVYNGGIDARLLADRHFGLDGRGCITFNAGMYYKMDKQHASATDSTEVDIYPNMSLPFGIGLSYDMGYLTPYVGFSAEYMMDTTWYPKPGSSTGELIQYDELNNPTWAIFGLRYYVGGFNITGGGEYNLRTDVREALPFFRGGEHWHAILGLHYAPKSETYSKVPATGIITGRVTDKATGKGILATVSAGGITANSNPAGEYRLEGIAIGKAPVEVRAEAKLYLAGSAAVQLTRKNRKVPAMQDFALSLAPIPPSEATGNVIDYKTGSPVGAVLTFKDAKGKDLITRVNVTTGKGAYSIMLEPGKYTVVARAEGYNIKEFYLNCADGKPVSTNLALVKTGEKFIFNNINFDFGKATLGPNAPQIMEGILKILTDNPEIKVEIGGHTDAIGSKVKNLKLSQARSQAVVEWLISKGISAGQLESKGYGAEQPIASNSTKSGRALNRRIEVTVIQ